MHPASEYLTLRIRLQIQATVYPLAEVGSQTQAASVASITGNMVICVKYSEWWDTYAKM